MKSSVAYQVAKMIIIKTQFAKDLWGISDIKVRLHPLRNKGKKASEPEVALLRHGVRTQIRQLHGLMA